MSRDNGVIEILLFLMASKSVLEKLLIDPDK